MSKNKLRMLYVTYADDWGLLTNRKKALATLLKNKIESFLKTYLNIQFSPTKTLIRNITDGFNFLGFNIKSHKNKSKKVTTQSIFYSIRRI